LLRTTYKPTWTLPGGCAEEGESPLQACLRELEEETGLIRTTGTLRCVDHRKPDADRVIGGLRFIFDLGALQTGEIQSLRLPAEEIAESRLVTPDEAYHLVDTAQARRLATVLKSLLEVIYLENGTPPGPLGM
jgi:8-oxo-dGTP diphosphatase